jgi:hypothetical protein
MIIPNLLRKWLADDLEEELAGVWGGGQETLTVARLGCPAEEAAVICLLVVKVFLGRGWVVVRVVKNFP